MIAYSYLMIVYVMGLVATGVYIYQGKGMKLDSNFGIYTFLTVLNFMAYYHLFKDNFNGLALTLVAVYISLLVPTAIRKFKEDVVSPRELVGSILVGAAIAAAVTVYYFKYYQG